MTDTATCEGTMSRRGRPRKTGSREPNGRPQRTRDQGTPEVMGRRAFLAQGGDATKVHFPLGVMLVNEDITTEQYTAGCRYAACYKTFTGRGSLAALAYDGSKGSGREISEAERAKRTAEFTASAEALLKAGRPVKDAIDNLVVFDRWPRWMKAPRYPRPSDLRNAELIVQGLKVLAR